MFLRVSSRIRLGLVAIGAVALTTASIANARGERRPSTGSHSADRFGLASILQPLQEPATLSAEEEKRFSDAWVQQPRVNLGEPAGTAKVIIVKFNDWL